jgi:Family of unknown function (DUF6515)
MTSIVSLPARMAAAGVAAISLALLLAGAASAEEHREKRHEMGEPYRAQHWIYDDRYHHSHYYPAVGYSVAVLPPGYLSLNFGSRRFYFHGGVWFSPLAGGFAVVRPPVGIVVPVLPPAYTTVWIAGAPYYYANDIYYSAAPGGFAVAAPPAGTYTETPQAMPAPQAMPSATPPAPPSGSPTGASSQSTGGMWWYYCDSAKGYYPYVPDCKEAWRPVPANPPQAR